MWINESNIYDIFFALLRNETIWMHFIEMMQQQYQFIQYDTKLSYYVDGFVTIIAYTLRLRFCFKNICVRYVDECD